MPLRKAALLCLLASAMALGQAVRIDPLPATSTSSQASSIGGMPQLLAMPSAVVTLCGYPASGLPCTNRATSYTDATGSVPCSTTAQIVLAGTSACTGWADKQGNFGFWLLPGTYTYTISFGGKIYGPYPVTAPAPTSGEEVDVTTRGVANTGVVNAQPGIASLMATNQSLYFPAGNYLIDLSAGTWGINGYSGTWRFSAGAKWTLIPPTNKASYLIAIGTANNLTISGMHLAFASDPSTCIQPGDIQCGPTLSIDSSNNVTIEDLTEDASQSAAIILSNTTNATLRNINLTNVGGTLFPGDKNLQITDLTCTNSRDDCINVASAFAQTGFYGATVKGLIVNGTGARCALISSPNTTLDGFTCIGAEDAGIGVEYSSCCTQTYAPDGVVISNGFIADVRNNGTATNPGFPKSCIYIDSDLSSIGSVSISNIICERPDGQGVNVNTTAGAVRNLSIENMQVFNAGNSVSGSLDGTCYYILSAISFQGTNNSCVSATGGGYLVGGNNGGTATIIGGYIFDANATQESHRAIDIEDFLHFNVSGLTIYDDRVTPLSYILAENNTPSGGSGIFHNINFGVTGNVVQLFTGTARAQFQDITPTIALGNLLSSQANGTRVYCSDCDTPASQGATCTNAGDHAGAQLQIMRGVKKCY